MQNKFILFWAWVSVILPLLLGFVFIFNPSQALPPNTTVNNLAMFLGLKNIVFSGLLLFAVLKKSNYVLTVLLIGRGITDILDGVAGMMSRSISVPYIGAVTTGIITVVAGYLLSKNTKAE